MARLVRFRLIRKLMLAGILVFVPRHRIGVEVVTAITKTMRMFQETAVSTNSLQEFIA